MPRETNEIGFIVIIEDEGQSYVAEMPFSSSQFFHGAHNESAFDKGMGTNECS